jgi:GAF domain-containing protein
MAIISERVSGILKVEDLLFEVVNQIKERFGYYHAHIYLLDTEGEKLVMAEGTGPAGAEMKAKGHYIPLEAETSLVAQAARSGKIVSVDDVREVDSWLPNPLLPDTKSEMAVPIVLATENRVVGVLDVQQDELSGLDESDSNMLRYLSNQIAVAIRNARLFEQAEAALIEARALQQRYLEQAWQKYLLSRPIGDRKFEYVQPGALEVSSETELLVEQKIGEESRPVLVDVDSYLSPDQPHQPLKMIAAPIAIQQKNIGSLKIYPMHDDQRWRDQDLVLVEAVLNQFVQLAENLRLLGETQERASRERLIGQISDKLRRAPDFETLMKIGVDELSEVLRPSQIFVQMGTGDNQPSTDETAGSLSSEESEVRSLPPQMGANGNLKQSTTNGRGDNQL